MLLSLRLNSFKMKQEISLSDALNYLLCRLTQRELSEKIGLDQWKLLVKMKDSSFTDEEKDLHIDLAKEMVNVEERCRLLVDEIGESEGFVEGSFISSEDIKL